MENIEENDGRTKIGDQTFTDWFYCYHDHDDTSAETVEGLNKTMEALR